MNYHVGMSHRENVSNAACSTLITRKSKEELLVCFLLQNI